MTLNLKDLVLRQKDSVIAKLRSETNVIFSSLKHKIINGSKHSKRQFTLWVLVEDIGCFGCVLGRPGKNRVAEQCDLSPCH
jgi:hypothetical protein